MKSNICTLFNLFNVLIACALALVGAWSNMLFMVIIALNTLIGIVQELHAKKLADELSLLSVPRARVIREGRSAEIPIHELVKGDVMELGSGNQVCSDSVVLTGQVEVNEALLTGESDPVLKRAGDSLLSGSFIVSGRCRACVEHVGMDNYAAKITCEAKKMRKVHSELLSAMRRVTRFTGKLIVPLGLLLFLEAVLLRGDGVHHAVVATAAGLLGMLPKGLVLLISVSLAAGIAALAKKKVWVQDLYSLETLAHVDTLCLDKTGTLTQGRMQVEEIRLTDAGRTLPFEEIMGSFLRHSEDQNATFQALQARFSPQDVFQPIEKIPFSSERKWSAMRFADFTFVIGAPERLAGADAAERFGEDLAKGRRILLAGITREPVASGKPMPPVEELAALVLTDPIRPHAAETLAYFQGEGVKLKLISGDHPAAVAALAKRAGFPNAEKAVDMSGITEEADIEDAARRYAVFGRVSPVQKKQLVRALRRNGHSVAMTGDGVNDLLALREADCSIAVAEGSDAARQMAQVVLLNSDFSALLDVLGQGRRVVNNTTRAAGVFFVKTIYSVLLSIACLLLNIPFPLIPIQVTLIDCIIEGYPAFLMSFEPDGRKVCGRWIPTVMRRALPNAIAIGAGFLLLRAGAWWIRTSPSGLCRILAVLLPQSQQDALFYLFVGTMEIQAVWKACWPLNRLRAFLCITTTGGFYAAAILFRSALQLAMPTSFTLLLAVCFALVGFLVERVSSKLIDRREAGLSD
ncbi:MAG: HAD-IC family P-type ATPase [Clostridia bacterium]|nr:HAD-IC family P-type ATPase [Clostridia bacterium]